MEREMSAIGREQTHRLMLPNAALITAFGSNKRMFSIGATARGDNLSTRAFMSQMLLRNICRSCNLWFRSDSRRSARRDFHKTFGVRPDDPDVYRKLQSKRVECLALLNEAGL